MWWTAPAPGIDRVIVATVPFLQCMSPQLCRFSDAGRHDASHALGRPASEKRQGTKSREVEHRRCGGHYGDLAAGSGFGRLERSGCGDRFAAKHRRMRSERAIWAQREEIGRATGGESGAPMRAWALPAESRPGWRSSLRLLIGGDDLMTCRS